MSDFVLVCFFAAAIAGMTLGSVKLNEWRCSTSGEIMEVESHYEPFVGCFVEFEGRKINIKYLREEYK